MKIGHAGPLTGAQLYTKINATLLTFGQPVVTTPPNKPVFPDLAPQNLLITNTAGVIAIKLTCPTDPGDSTMVRAVAPVSQGREVAGSSYIIGTCPTPTSGSSDITGLYTAKFGVPAVGQKVFVQVNQMVDGHESIPVTFSYIVPDHS